MPYTPKPTGRPPWRAHVLTLFPEVFPGPLGASLSGQALCAGIWTLAITHIRDFGLGRHRAVDDTPAGGGAGMVLRADVLAAAIDHAQGLGGGPLAAGSEPASDAMSAQIPLVYLSPRGTPFTQEMARTWAEGPGVMLLAGRFEGVDERVIEARAMREVSIGDYVLSGGEIAAMAVIDACVRLLPGVLGGADSLAHESFEQGLLEYPQFTKPREWEGRPIPDVLLSGDHKRVDAWRRAEAERITRERRPDLLRRE
jgi:tRNA (guanine37-N1)-methyltransferase